ncbi:serine hydrolase domain-containing protein [Mucilaginibacter lacusdianchii]|uniref:serine hydrolase domain-containing protein n=1 Tax=Mucilaginibacter lacusdianchii TaxID=2684211 RepID=UPI00131A6313|nr:serine hydrolase domain-containing protein [Mucilaginibacter sp. JXJ CY 39]
MKRHITIIILLLLTCLAVKAQNNHTKFDNLLNAYVAVHQFNGSALIIQDGKKVYEKSFGYQNAATKSLITKNSVFPIGSLTKPFTALIILKLAEEKKLSVNDPISKYIPDYPRGNEIIIKHLLTHTAGIYESFRNPKYRELLNTKQAFRPEDKIAFFRNEPLDFEPGSKFSYSNSGYDLLGSIIEKVTKLPYPTAVNRYIFDPLKMNKSGFYFEALSDTNKVTGYSYISAAKQVEIKFWNPTLTYASGALYSTTGDLLKLYNGLINFKIISKQTFDAATTPFKAGYGYGWFIDTLYGDRVIDHGGNVAGATSYLLMMPERKTCIILLNNITSTALEKIGNSMYAVLQNKPYTIPKPKQEIQLNERTLLKYMGTYEVSKNYKVEILKEADALFMKINNEDIIKLSAEREGTFFSDEDMVLEFIDKDDKIIGLKIKQGLSTKVADKIGS